MSRVVAIGASEALLGYGLVGVEVVAASDPDAVRLAWAGLDAKVGFVLLTVEAKHALDGLLDEREEVLWTTVPG
jgi:vacuolar-type H+-ATPase subunit F/Vma7